MKKFRMRLSAIALFGMVALPLGTANAAGEVNIYNWSDYIGDNTVADFEKKYSVKTRYDNFDSNETLHAKLVAGGTGYDIVVPTATFGKIQIDGGLFQPLDKTKIPNYKNLDPAIMAQLATIDPGNKYLVPWAWGYNTLGINVDKVKNALGDLPMPDDEWELLYNPKYVSKLKSCGVSMLDSPSEVLPMTLKFAGKSINSKIPADYEDAGNLLKSIRPFITLFSSSGYIDELAKGSLCLSYGWSGDIAIASRRAKEAKNGQNIKVLIPKKGAGLFYDVMAIPKDAKNVDNAHLWINNYLDPQVSADMTNKVSYANANKASLPFVNKEIASDPAVFLSANDLKRMWSNESPTQDIRRLQTRTFTKFKSGI